MEDSGAEGDLMNCGGLIQEVSEKKNFSMLPRDNSCDILVNNDCFLLLSKESV